MQGLFISNDKENRSGTQKPPNCKQKPQTAATSSVKPAALLLPESSDSRLNRVLRKFVLWSLMAVLGLGAATTSSAQSDDVFEKSFEYGPEVTVKVDNAGGKTAIEVWGEDLIHVIANKRGTRQSVQSVEVAIMQTRTSLSVVCTPQRSANPIDLKIYIPRRSHLRLQSSSGDIEILGPVSSATAETQTGDVLLEAPSSQDAEVALHSTNGMVTAGVGFSVCDINNVHNVHGKIGQGGAPIVLRSLSGNVSMQPLRPQLALLMKKDAGNTSSQGNNGSYDSTTPYPSSNPTPDQPPVQRPAQRPAVTWPDPDPNAPPVGSPRSNANGGYTDVFGSKQDTKGSSQQYDSGALGSRTRQDDSSIDTSGGLRVRIIPPPGSPGPARTPAADDALRNGTIDPGYGTGDPSTATNRGNSGGGSLNRRSNTTAADDVLSTLPNRDPGPTNNGPNPPRIVRRGDDGSPLPGNKKADDDDSSDAIKLDTKLVNLNVNVSDRSGRALTNLSQADFAVYEDDVKQEVSHFVPVSSPFNLVLLLDLSGSTRDKIETIKQTALRFVAATNPQDKVAVVAFTRGVQVVCRPTANRELLKQRIRDMRRTDGGTAFYEAMWFSMTDVLREIQGERNAIVVMTDGVDNAMSAAYPAPSRVSFKQMIDKILESGTLVYPIYLDTEPENQMQQWGETPEVYALARTQLQQMADASGGVLFKCERVEDLGNVYERVAAELRTLYSLGYYPSSFVRDGQWKKIKVKVNGIDSVTRTRRGYYAK
ncbi:MAG: VWA domain-containing protein [Blastocatellia bacterium]|nr:VWA domain-containing protein [Blastocatellia bacterium]